MRKLNQGPVDEDSEALLTGDNEVSIHNFSHFESLTKLKQATGKEQYEKLLQTGTNSGKQTVAGTGSNAYEKRSTGM